MSIVMGCDIGSLTSKVVILNDRRILGTEIIQSKSRPELSAETVMQGAMEKAKINQKDILFCVGTGYGRKQVPLVDKTVSEINCHARGARWMLPSVRTIIDIGGQDCKAIRMDDQGNVVKFIANDKCASGTGRFLEVMAKLLHVSVDELGELSAKATKSYSMAATCTLWAQSEVIKRINSGYAIADIAAGINKAMAARAAILLSGVGITDDVLMTGGVAKNKGVITDLEQLISHPIKRIRNIDPQLAGALGAAVIAKEMIRQKEGQK
jgi:(R)-2-hydroxyacyl-CoA dehydratese activating ATPase